jgi:hypothetical protein
MIITQIVIFRLCVFNHRISAVSQPLPLSPQYFGSLVIVTPQAPEDPVGDLASWPPPNLLRIAVEWGYSNGKD